MRARMSLGRICLLGAASASVAVVAMVGVGAVTGDRGTKDVSDSALPPPAANHYSPSPEFVWHTPVTAVAPDTQVQHETTQAFLEALSRQPGMAAAAALPVPEPKVAGGWPNLPVELTPEGWARQFVKGLLTIDYARMSRSALGPWLQAQEAPALIPGVPQSVADKMLYTSLVATEVFGGQPTPIPSAAEWEANARAGAKQWVSDIQVQVNPRWAQLVATGWQPPDLRMAILDVSGRLMLQHPDAVSTNQFAMQLLVGSARWRDGYGTVSVFGWQREAQ